MHQDNQSIVLDGSREAQHLIIAAEVAGESVLASHVYDQEQRAYEQAANNGNTDVNIVYDTLQIPLAPEHTQVAMDSLNKVVKLNKVYAVFIRAGRKFVQGMLDQYESSITSEESKTH